MHAGHRRRSSSRFLDDDSSNDSVPLLDEVITALESYDIVAGGDGAPPRPPGVATRTTPAGLQLGPPLGPLRPSSQISWADGVSEDDDYFASLAARQGGAARGSSSTVSASTASVAGSTAGAPGSPPPAYSAGPALALVRQPSSASESSEEAASAPLLGAQPVRPTVVVTCPSPSGPSWVAVDVPGTSDTPGQDEQPRRRLHRRNSISMPSLPTGLEMEHAAAEYDARLGRGHGDGYNTSDSFSDEEDDEEGQRRGLGRGRDPSRGDATGTVAGSSNGAPPGVGGGGGGGGGSRRKSAMAKASDDELGLESDRHPDLSSPANSITSINSISSLLKEKLAMSLPAMLKRHRKPKEYKLRGFVAMLFLCIVFLVGFAHVYYNQQVLQKAYFDRIRLNHLERVVRVYNAEGAELLRGELGRFLRATDKVYQCLHEDERKGAYCMEWMGRARLYLRYEEEGNFRCYHINWKALAHDVFPTDCFDLTSAGGSVSHWYGGGHAAGMRWPLEAGRVSWAPFLTGDSGRRDHQWGNVLKRFFISSKGVAITVNPRTPLHVAANQYNDGELCLQAKYDDFAFVRPTPSSAAWLNYTLCTVSTGNMRELHQHLSEKSLWDGLTEADVEIVNTLLTQPVWQIAPAEADLLTEQAILNYTEDVLSLGFLQHGHILVNEFWQANVGDMAMDESRFPTMEETIKIVHRRGFRIAFTLQPFIGTESINFREAVRRKLLVGTRGGGPGREYTPALSRYRSLLSAGALDVTNKRSVPWFKEMLEDLLQRYKMDCFFLDLGVAYDLPYHYKFQGPLTNPDHFMTAFTELVQSSVTVLGVSSAIARPRVPTFVTLPAVPSTWKGLQSVIPTILTYGIIGYPFIMPGAVGGDYDEEPSSDIGSTAGPLASVLTGRNATTTTTPPAAAFADMAGPADDADVLEEAMEGDGTSGESLGTGNGLGAGLGAGLGQGPGVGAGAALGLGVGPSSGEEELQEVVRLADTELYVRWMQLASFLPVVRYTTLPNKYGSELILESARTLTSLRQKIVNPLLKKYAREALDSGLPLVRPLWMLDPLDPACRLLSDEFSIGEELIVAPVLQPGSTERDVYLPTGVWKDGIDGSLRKGSRWIHMYKVPLDKIAYFVKMPDNTRF